MKFHWMKFYPADWIADLGHHNIEIEGMWIRICSHIYRRGVGGYLEMGINEWKNLLGKSEEETKNLLQYVTLTKLGNVTECNGLIKVTCRRLEREAEQRFQTYERVKNFRLKRKCNKNVTVGCNGQKLEARSKKQELQKSDKETTTTFARSDKKKSLYAVIPKIEFNFEKKKFEGITDEDVRDWGIAYPACNIEQEISKMALWLIANPEKRKIKYRRFMMYWLKDRQDRGGTR